MSRFCFLRVKTVPSEEDSASCGVLAGLIKSLIAVSYVNCVLPSELLLREPLKNEGDSVKGEVLPIQVFIK